MSYPRAPGKRRFKIGRLKDIFIFAGPAILAFAIFKYIPLIQGVKNSFISWTPSDASMAFVGFKNYMDTLVSAHFWGLMLNTVIIFLFYLAFNFWVPVFQAVLLSQIKRGHNAMRFLMVLPAAIPGMVGVIIWLFFWNPTYGLANAVLAFLNMAPSKWLTDPAIVKPVLLLPGILGGGLSILIYLAAINNIPEEVHESATIDGASSWQRVRYITLPLLRSTVEIQFILALSTALLQFDYVFAMTKGGPGYSSTTVVMGTYFKAFSEFRYSEAAAWAMIITLCSVILTAISLKMSKGETN